MADVERLVNALAVVVDNENLRIVVDQSTMGAAVTGAATILGGLIGGRLGLIVGGAIGAAAAGAIAGDFRTVGDIIQNYLTDRQREVLALSIMGVVGITAVGALMERLRIDPQLRSVVLQEIRHFFARNTNLQLVEV